MLAPGGLFVFNVWDQLANNEVSLIVTRAVQALYPQDPPRFVERTPFGYFDAAAIRAELQATGFQHIELEAVELVSQAVSAEHVAIGILQGHPTAQRDRAPQPTRVSVRHRAATTALQSRFGTGPFENRMSALVATAHRP